MKKFTKSIIFSTTLVMAATSQAQQMEEHEHKGLRQARDSNGNAYAWPRYAYDECKNKVDEGRS